MEIVEEIKNVLPTSVLPLHCASNRKCALHKPHICARCSTVYCGQCSSENKCGECGSKYTLHMFTMLDKMMEGNVVQRVDNPTATQPFFKYTTPTIKFDLAKLTSSCEYCNCALVDAHACPFCSHAMCGECLYRGIEGEDYRIERTQYGEMVNRYCEQCKHVREFYPLGPIQDLLAPVVIRCQCLDEICMWRWKRHRSTCSVVPPIFDEVV